MVVWRQVGIFGLLIIMVSLERTDSYFGLTEKKVYLEQLDGSTEWDCKRLSKKQKKMCRRDTGMPETLYEAIRLSQRECQIQFHGERWNCTSGDSYIVNILKKGYKETSILYAISSAGLTHTVASACSQGTLDRCTCDESFNDQENKEAWQWGGCGDNIKYSQKFVQNFLNGKKSGKDFRAIVEKHNSDVGVRVIRQEVKETCKCHGVSGSCASRTCWRQLRPFSQIGKLLKDKYENAIKVVSTTNESTGKTQLVTKRRKGKKEKEMEGDDEADNNEGASPKDTDEGASPRDTDLVYVDKSPNFCTRSKFTPGTSGRVCLKDTNCQSICCGRGYNIKSKIVEKPCRCRVVWCCYVDCDMCTEREEIHLCK
ncbi:protein Wnt-9a-like [Glandiceps talaboti]